MSRIQSAVCSFKENLDCAQALLSTYGPELGLDRETAIRVADAFGGGMGRMGETCGAVTGALMVLSLRHGGRATGAAQERRMIHSFVNEFVRRFSSRNGSTVCRELLHCDISNPEVFNSRKTRKLFETACPKYVRDAAEIIEDLLELT